MIAKVIELKKDVEVIVKKVVTNDNFGFTMNFVALMEDKSMVNTTLTAEYDSEKDRDKDFDAMTFHNLNEMAKGLTGFKHVMK